MFAEILLKTISYLYKLTLPYVSKRQKQTSVRGYEIICKIELKFNTTWNLHSLQNPQSICRGAWMKFRNGRPIGHYGLHFTKHLLCSINFVHEYCFYFVGNYFQLAFKYIFGILM